MDHAIMQDCLYIKRKHGGAEPPVAWLTPEKIGPSYSMRQSGPLLVIFWASEWTRTYDHPFAVWFMDSEEDLEGIRQTDYMQRQTTGYIIYEKIL